MSSELLGILQLDRGEPWGYAQLPGLIQSWLQDAGGFAAVGMVVYVLYALSAPTDKSQSEKLRVPLTRWMLLLAGLALVAYAVVAITFFFKSGTSLKFAGFELPVAPPERPPPMPGETVRIEPPTWHTELRPMALMVAGFFALLAIGQPFAWDMLKIARRNVTFGTGGLTRFGRSLRAYAADLLTPSRVAVLGAALAVYLLVGAALFVLGVPRLTEIWTQVLLVGVGVFVCALLLLMLFEAEGPVWAIAKLSFKEAVRSQVLWIFLIGILPFLFPLQWVSLANTKPSDEMRGTTVLITVFLSLLTLIPAALITSFGIPNDIKNLNIFTVVSKPIERFEIVLGRFVGYTALMTLVMLALTGVSLVLVTNSNASDKARAETYTARVPYRGKMEFKSIVAAERQEKREFSGTNVGREFDYRRYITGAPASPQRIIWKFASVPGELKSAGDDKVTVEFTFDIFRMTKGVQNKGAGVTFTFVTQNAPLRQPQRAEVPTDPDKPFEWPWVQDDRRKEYEAKVAQYQAQGINPLDQSRARPGTREWEAVNKLAEEFGYYEIKNKEVFDYQVMSVEVPAGLLRNALATSGDKMPKDADGTPLPRLSVYVKCEDGGQMLGAAEPDLYLLQSEMPYSLNFLKATVGLWCRLCIVIGVAIAFSTYLSGVLSLLATALIYIVGFFTDHLSDLANNRNVGGGPFQTISQLVKAEQPTAPLSDSASTKALLFGDKIWAWLIRRIQNMIPDVDSFSWGHFVSEGFNINTEYLVLNLIVTFGYLLPWAILAYYLMKAREVAA
jgi:ABC-type transport system involved in multi-copper enzyme maturation permease subunit